VLSAFLSVTAVLVSWEAICEQRRAYYTLLLLLESGMLGVFTAQDIMLFYVFFEFTLIPLFFLIGIWGGPERRLAARTFFIYTLAGSVLTFVGLIYIVSAYYAQTTARGVPELTFDIPWLTAAVLDGSLRFTVREQTWLFLALMAGFAIKVPLFPFHTWLPLAHVEAPTAGSVILAGVLLKIGTYGFLRFSLCLFPAASHVFLGFLCVLSVIGIIYGALVSLAQADIKRLIAYSSVSHLGFCMLGLFALNTVGISGGLLQMVNHGLSTGALFALVGMLYERYHTRDIAALGGLARRLPVLAFFFLVITLSSIGLPGLNGFIGEFLVLAGAFQVQRVYAVLAAVGIILGAFYMLWLVQRVFFGELVEPEHGPEECISDLCGREVWALAPIAAICLWIGLYPNYFLRRMEPAVARVVRQLEASIGKTTLASVVDDAADLVPKLRLGTHFPKAPLSALRKAGNEGRNNFQISGSGAPAHFAALSSLLASAPVPALEQQTNRWFPDAAGVRRP
jgi:NADH-quinone oxidoreductase subunit M